MSSVDLFESRLSWLAPVAQFALGLLVLTAQGDDPAEWIRALDSDDPKQAIETLVKLGPPAVPSLILGLQDPSARIRSGSARTLGRMRQVARPAIPALATLLESASTDGDAARAASEALVSLGSLSQPAVPGLGQLVRNPERGFEARVLAAWTLGGLSGPVKEASNELSACLGSSPPVKLELSLSIALAHGGPETLPELRKALGAAAGKYKRMRALAILNAIAVCGGKSSAGGKDVVELARDPMLRPAVVLAFDKLGGEKPLRALLAELLGREVRESPIYPALYAQEHTVDLGTTLQGLGLESGAVKGPLPTALRWTNANGIGGLTPAGSTTMGDVLEGMAEFLCSRWYELASRSIRDGLPSFESLSTDLDALVGPAEFLRVVVPDEAYWSPGKKKK